MPSLIQESKIPRKLNISLQLQPSNLRKMQASGIRRKMRFPVHMSKILVLKGLTTGIQILMLGEAIGEHQKKLKKKKKSETK